MSECPCSFPDAGTIARDALIRRPGISTTVGPSPFNPETWDFDYGRPFTRETEDEIIEALRPSWIQGLSILGGEPTEEENAAVLIPFLKRVRAALPDKDIWLYSGYTYEALRDKEILTLVDVLVDGPFLLEQKDAGLAFRGSRNQRIIDLREKES